MPGSHIWPSIMALSLEVVTHEELLKLSILEVELPGIRLLVLA
jgi:hypothetical protein